MNSVKEIEKLVCCGQEIKLHSTIVRKSEETEKTEYTVAFYRCEKCGKEIQVYPNSEIAWEMRKKSQEKALVKFFKKELEKRGYHCFEDKKYENHNDVLLANLKEVLSDTEMNIRAEKKGDKAIIYLESDCYGSSLKLPLVQVPINTKNIECFDYIGIGWFEDEEDVEPTPKDIWTKDIQNKIYSNLYDCLKNSPKKLKIVCDWDEVIQATEPCALWKVPISKGERECEFSEFFEAFWQGGTSGEIKYSPYGSKLVVA